MVTDRAKFALQSLTIIGTTVVVTVLAVLFMAQPDVRCTQWEVIPKVWPW